MAAAAEAAGCDLYIPDPWPWPHPSLPSFYRAVLYVRHVDNNRHLYGISRLKSLVRGHLARMHLLMDYDEWHSSQ